MKAILALSADPITYGHIDVIKRAREMFSPLLVAIGVNPDKKYLFDLNVREQLAREALRGFDGVEIVSFQGLLIDFAKLNGVKTIIRSVRDSTDFNYEKMLNDINISQKQGIDTIIFFARQELTHISSSAVKELQKHHGSIVEYVPLNVKQALEKRISDQFLLGITGEIGAGKSFVSDMIGTFKPITILDLDVFGRKILTEYTQPLYVETREKLVSKIGSDILESKNDWRINPKKLTSRMFKDRETLRLFNEIMTEPTLFALRQNLINAKGVVFIGSALMAEGNLSYLTNNNVLLIKANSKVRDERLHKRGYLMEEIASRTSSQFNFEKKYETIHNKINETGHGTVVIFDNSHSVESDFHKLIETLQNIYHLWE